MQSERFLVKYITVNNCFAYLPDTWLRKLETKENVIEILHKGKTYYLSCNARSISNGTLCLGPSFARSLNINEGEEVFVCSVKDVPFLTKISVAPRTTNDREILELQIEKVQSTLLSQIRVVAKNQPIVAWVSKFTSVTLIVESLEPNLKYGKLEQFSEIHVGDALAKSEPSNEPKKQNNVPSKLIADFRKMLPFKSEENKLNVSEIERNEKLLHSFCNRKKPMVYRAHPLPNRIEDNPFNIIASCPYHVFVPRRHAPKFSGNFALCRVKKMAESKQHQNATSTNFLVKVDSSVPELSTELIVRLFIVEDVFDGSSTLNHFNVNFLHKSVYVSDSVRISLNLKTGSKISLCLLEASENVAPSSIELFSLRNSVSLDSFRSYVAMHSNPEKLLINSCAALVVDGNCCVVKISPDSCTYGMVDGIDVEKTKVSSRSVNEESQLRVALEKQEHSGLGKVFTRYLKNVLLECELTLDLSLGLRTQLGFEYDRENILISGALGTGKTTVCKILTDYLQKPPYFVHTHAIDCRSLKGKKAEMLQKILINALNECVYYEPSVLFLDDIESITNASTNDEENTPDATNAARITDILINTVTQYQESHYVSVIATCAGVGKIGQKLRPARGCHFFRTVLTIPNLEKADRIDILQLMLRDKWYVPGEDVNWDYYGNKTEGWMVQDLVDLAQKATYVAWNRHGMSKPPVIITEEDMSNALQNYTPISLQGIQLYKGTGHMWSDIGGLAEVKRSLVEILQWPLKYPEVFKNAPIKLQNGVLLYGMPGTGKTMLAKAIANECGVNLISVKGPELLSKYIGASEESVRNMFERALRAKPCVLFFDEFDSLAPRRGHDSTGVTDRVVNQLLTQMDGVEDREGVAVVAASSRPDLLDSALLRPGRLDKALYCPLPDEADREEILAVLCKAQKIDHEDLDLKELAGITSGFTGADLNAVVTQAKLTAFEEDAENLTDGKITAKDFKVTQQHLIDSIRNTHPSLSAAEKEKYKRIYARFSRNDNFIEDVVKNQKATLA
nr:PREDICTED: peroxisome biogenesis factor 1 [Megachile rotundata]XP_012151141.1 PREDICTED: peroxisome biogenesis factor 1 [Megachile rotundata]XP_012151142.1 PREDICTED: peroxisome biogenesis factor 1 [Megachile rotundata]